MGKLAEDHELRGEIFGRHRVEDHAVEPNRAARHASSVLAEGAFHDLGGPLTYLLANLEYLDCQLAGHEEDLPQGRASELRQCLHEATLGAARIRDIVRDAAGRTRPSESRCDLRLVLLSCIKVARTEIDHRARVITEFDALPQVAGNESRLSRLFLNLIVNAAQAVVGDPENEHFIRVVTRAEANRKVTVEITDSGPGISEEHLSRVFEPYFTTKPAGEGTGLGLAICKHIVDELGGSISVTSTLARGATFRVTLPIADDVSPSNSPPNQSGNRFLPSTPPVRRLPLRQIG
jgi:two-component system NtrC family sensor kinase